MFLKNNLDGKTTNGSLFNSIANSSSACNSFGSTTTKISNNNLQSQLRSNNLLNQLNINCYGSNIKNDKLRKILAQHQRNNVNNFVQKISERFHQKQNINNNNNEEQNNQSITKKSSLGIF